MLDFRPSIQGDADGGRGNENLKKRQADPPSEPNVLGSRFVHNFHSNSGGAEQSQIQSDSGNKGADVETKVENHDKTRQTDFNANQKSKSSSNFKFCANGRYFSGRLQHFHEKKSGRSFLNYQIWLRCDISWIPWTQLQNSQEINTNAVFDIFM